MSQRAFGILSPRYALAALACCAAFTFLSAESARAQELTGCWEGCWDNWHDIWVGDVKARFWKCDDMHYKGEFKGIALFVIPYKYYSTFTITKVEGDKTYFKSYKHLPVWGGYTMCGYIQGCKFVAKYDKCDGSGGGCWYMNKTCHCPNCCK